MLEALPLLHEVEAGDRRGFDKTRSNDHGMHTDHLGRRGFDGKFSRENFEDFDFCFVFPKVPKNENKLMSQDLVRQSLLDLFPAREGNVDKLQTTDTMHSIYGLWHKDINKMNKSDFLNLVYRTFVRIFDAVDIFHHKEENNNFHFIRARMSEAALLLAADRENYPLQLDREVTTFQELRQDPAFVPPHLPFERRIEDRSTSVGALASFGHIWQRYDRISRPYHAEYIPVHDDELSVFRAVDRLRLTKSTLNDFVNLGLAQRQGWLKSYYPLHQEVIVENLRKKWGSCRHIFSWSQPLDEVRNYFGEEVAVYFAWLGFFARSLVFPAVFGPLVFLCQWFDLPSTWINSLRIFHCLVMAIWVSSHFQMWRRRQKELNLRWGMELMNGAVRIPEETFFFKSSSYRPHPIYPGRWMRWSSPFRRYLREFGTLLVLIFATCTTVALINSDVVVALLGVLGLSSEWFQLTFLVSPLGISRKIAIPFMVSLAVKLFDLLWIRFIAYRLAEFENHQYTQKYKNSVNFKVFFFKFFNHFSPLFYLAFLKEFVNPCTDRPDGRCVIALRRQLLSLFFLGLVSNAVEIVKPMFKYIICRHPRNLPTYQKQFFLDTYDGHRGITSDWLEVMIQFGFTALFSLVYPPMTLISFFVVLIEIRTDAYRLCCNNRRPVPTESADRGVWDDVQRSMVFSAVCSNVFLACFVAMTQATTFRLAWSLGMMLCGTTAKEFIEFRIPIESKKYELALARMQTVALEVVWGDRVRPALYS